MSFRNWFTCIYKAFSLQRRAQFVIKFIMQTNNFAHLKASIYKISFFIDAGKKIRERKFTVLCFSSVLNTCAGTENYSTLCTKSPRIFLRLNVISSHLPTRFVTTLISSQLTEAESEEKYLLAGCWCLLNLSKWMIKLDERRNGKLENFWKLSKALWWCCVRERNAYVYMIHMTSSRSVVDEFRGKVSQLSNTIAGSNTCFALRIMRHNDSVDALQRESFCSLSKWLQWRIQCSSSLSNLDLEKCPWMQRW